MTTESTAPKWREVPISTLAHFSRGISWRKAEESSDGILVVSIPNIKDGRIDFGSKYNHYITKTIPENKKLRIGDIIFVGSSGSLHNVGRNAKVKELPTDVAAFASFAFKARPDISEADPDFLYFLCNSSQVPFNRYTKRAADGKYNFQLRDFEKNLRLKVPRLPEQKAIARVLTIIQDAITEQERLIQKLKELKRSMMNHLFTHGTKGEKTKITEIGEVPESWHVIPLGEALILAQYGLSKKGSEAGSYPVLRMTNQRDGYIHLDNLQYVELTPTELKKFELHKDDIIFNRTNSIDLVGRTAIYKQEKKDVVFASYLIRLKVDANTLLPDFLNCYFNTEDTQRRLKGIATRGVSQSNISATRLATLMIPLPSRPEQQAIVLISRSIDRKIEAIFSKRRAYERLFKTLLHELMSGERRIQNI